MLKPVNANEEIKRMAKQESLRTSECPVARTLESIGERWCLMIIREAFDDVRRFSEFQKNLGLARNILSSRLKQLVDIGVFEICPASDGSAYSEYVLTEKGRSIFPIVVAIRQWGERNLFEKGEIHSVLVDNALGEPVQSLEVRSSDGNKLAPGDCHRRRVRKGEGEDPV
jgi:DNA-binding HxlR family transcriptional regulator